MLLNPPTFLESLSAVRLHRQIAVAAAHGIAFPSILSAPSKPGPVAEPAPTLALPRTQSRRGRRRAAAKLRAAAAVKGASR